MSSEAVESGTSLAWRLLCTLEGGTLALATSAILGQAARRRLQASKEHQILAREAAAQPRSHSVIISNDSPLAHVIKKCLEAHECTVHTVTSGAGSGVASRAVPTEVDALVVLGADTKAIGLEGLANIVEEDVHSNLKLLESLSPNVRRGGRLVWARCKSEATSSAYSGAGDALDNVLRIQLQLVANKLNCEAAWVGCCSSAEEVVSQVLSALVPNVTPPLHLSPTTGYSLRNAASRIVEFVWRWFKTIS